MRVASSEAAPLTGSSSSRHWRSRESKLKAARFELVTLQHKPQIHPGEPFPCPIPSTTDDGGQDVTIDMVARGEAASAAARAASAWLSPPAIGAAAAAAAACVADDEEDDEDETEAAGALGVRTGTKGCKDW